VSIELESSRRPAPAKSIRYLDPAERDGRGRLAAMPLSVGRYLRSLPSEDCEELGQWLMRRADQIRSDRRSENF